METNFDTWTSLFLFAAAQGLFLSVILFLKKERNTSVLAVMVLMFSVTLVEYVFFWTGYRFTFPHLNNISMPLFFLYGPLLLILIETHYGIRKPIKEYWIHFIPFLLLLIYYLPYYVMGTEEKLVFASGQVQFSELRFLFIRAIPWLQIVSLFAYTLIAFRRQGLSSESNGSHKSVINNILVAFTGFVVSFLSYYLMVTLFSYNKTSDYVISIAMSVFIYYIGYLGYSGLLVVNGNRKKYRNSVLTEKESDQIIKILNEAMLDQKVFLERTLSLDELSNKVGTPKHHLSQVLNEFLEKSFSDFVNEYRVEEAKKLLCSEELNLSMNGIAEESGFNNRTTFNTAFKKFTGLTPSEFRRSSSKAVNSD